MFKTAAATAALLIAAGAANAALLDFETGYTANKTAITGNEFVGAFDVSFSSPNGLNIVKVGNPTDAFVPNDTPNPADAFGDFFLTSNFGTVTSLSIAFGTGVSAASFDVGDIDGSGLDLEKFTFIARDAGGNALEQVLRDGNSADTGDAVVTRIGFSGYSDLIKTIDITGTTQGGTRKIGIAFDNFNTTIDTTAVPLPAGLPLAAAAFGALGLVRARRKS